MKTYWLQRNEDKSGVSGTGIVAEVVEFDSGKCVVAWKTDTRSVAIYDSIEDVIKIHGHGGKTKLVTSTRENSWHMEKYDECDDFIDLVCGWWKGRNVPRFRFFDDHEFFKDGYSGQTYSALRRLCDFLNGSNPDFAEYLGEYDRIPATKGEWRKVLKINAKD